MTNYCRSLEGLWQKRSSELERRIFVIVIIGFICSILPINASAAVISLTSPLGKILIVSGFKNY